MFALIVLGVCFFQHNLLACLLCLASSRSYHAAFHPLRFVPSLFPQVAHTLPHTCTHSHEAPPCSVQSITSSGVCHSLVFFLMLSQYHTLHYALLLCQIGNCSPSALFISLYAYLTSLLCSGLCQSELAQAYYNALSLHTRSIHDYTHTSIAFSLSVLCSLLVFMCCRKHLHAGKNEEGASYLW